jgi:hypothetical protein
MASLHGIVHMLPWLLGGFALGIFFDAHVLSKGE